MSNEHFSAPNYILVSLYHVTKTFDAATSNDGDIRKWRKRPGDARAAILADAQFRLESDPRWSATPLNDQSIVTGSSLIDAASNALRASINTISPDDVQRFMVIPATHWNANNFYLVEQQTVKAKQRAIMAAIYEYAKYCDASTTAKTEDIWRRMLPRARYEVIMACRKVLLEDWRSITLSYNQGNMVVTDEDLSSLDVLTPEAFQNIVEQITEDATPKAYKPPSNRSVSDKGQPVNSMDGLGDSGSEHEVVVSSYANENVITWIQKNQIK